MKNPFLPMDLLDFEARILKKIDRLVCESKGMFPLERLKKGRQLLVLSSTIRFLIQSNLEDEAMILLDLLLDLGADLPGR